MARPGVFASKMSLFFGGGRDGDVIAGFCSTRNFDWGWEGM